MARTEGTGAGTGEVRDGENAEVISGAGATPTLTAAEAAEAVKAAREAAAKAKAEAAEAVKAARKALADAKAAEKAAASGPSDSDYVREISRLLIEHAGTLVAKGVPEGQRAAVAAKLAARLHHLVTPNEAKDNWPVASLPVPDRSEWK